MCTYIWYTEENRKNHGRVERSRGHELVVRYAGLDGERGGGCSQSYFCPCICMLEDLCDCCTTLWRGPGTLHWSMHSLCPVSWDSSARQMMEIVGWFLLPFSESWQFGMEKINIIIWAPPILCPMVSSSPRREIRTNSLIKFAWASCLLKPHDLRQNLKHLLQIDYKANHVSYFIFNHNSHGPFTVAKS